MNLKQFEVLRYIVESLSNEITQRMIAEELKISLGGVNSILSELQHMGLIADDYRITDTGRNEMECYHVDNAIVLAAGMSTRFVPFSFEKPKGLTVVKGEVLIERQIKQLKKAGVKEIVVVLGHMMEKFLYLIDKFGVKVVVNNEYRYKNTHSSIYFARDYLKSSYICCSDNYFPQSVFHQYEFQSLYSTEYMEGTWRGERGVVTDKEGLIIATQRPAVNQWVMNGYAYFNCEFSEKFKTILESVYDTPGSDNLYWEQVYAEHVDELMLYEKRYTDKQVMEFDSVEELEKFDPEFVKYNDMVLTRNICSTLNCSPSDIHEIRPIQKGYTNKSFRFLCRDKMYVYRTPGIVSADWLDRRSEKEALEIAKRLGIDDSYIYEDWKTGWKVSSYVNVTENFDFKNPVHVQMLCDCLHKLYKIPRTCGRLRDYLYETKRLLEKLRSFDEDTYRIAKEPLPEIETIDRLVKSDGWDVRLVHNDLYEDNLLISGNKLYLIDWEYVGDSDIGYDLCKLFVKNDAEGSAIDKWLSFYYGRIPTKDERKHIIGCAAISFYYWYVWALYMIKRGNDFSDLMLKYLSITKRYQREFNM